MKPLYSDGDYDREGVDPGQTSPWRPPFTRDYGRIVHSASFRRLQGKTQVFPGHESDFFRNRLTHSLEVAQIAEGIADRLNHEYPFFQAQKINGGLCAIAALRSLASILKYDKVIPISRRSDEKLAKVRPNSSVKSNLL